MSSLIRELDPLPPVPPRPPYTPLPITPPIFSDPPPLRGEALKRRQEACVRSFAFVLNAKGESNWTIEEINAICLVPNPPIYEGPDRIL